ncbi:vacuolar alkaline phosphatase [Coemansia sp. RSA 986]|nr:vacuolar alkaline phosphatase [Coemansia sp. RSA 986]
MKYHFLHTATVAVLLAKISNGAPAIASSPKRNLIFMISDGFGQTSEAMARAYIEQQGNNLQWASSLDSLLVGSVRTRSSDTWVTDSAAGATAYSCAQKTYNGAIGVDKDGRACGTVLEAAKLNGYLTGLVTTSRITHATPAAFATHVVDRDMEDLIAQQLLVHDSSPANAPSGPGNRTVIKPLVDVLLGGGLCHFVPKGSSSPIESCRSDSLDLWNAAQSSGYTTVTGRRDFDALPRVPQLPLLGLFASSHMAYEIDRDYGAQPSLQEMTLRALDILHSQSNTTAGFFVMIEGARIDMAGHDNDPATHLRDILEYWRTVDAVRAFVDSHPDTLLVSTSDHETGGLTLGVDPQYLWHPQLLGPVTKSAESICSQLNILSSKEDDNDDGTIEDYVSDTVFPKYLGILNATDAEIDSVVRVAGKDGKKCKRTVGGVVSQRAHIGWSTGGHTGTDVGLYAYGRGSSAFHGNMDNTQVGQALAAYLGVSLNSATQVVQRSAQLVLSKRQSNMFIHKPYIDHN